MWMSFNEVLQTLKHFKHKSKGHFTNKASWIYLIKRDYTTNTTRQLRHFYSKAVVVSTVTTFEKILGQLNLQTMRVKTTFLIHMQNCSLNQKAFQQGNTFAYPFEDRNSQKKGFCKFVTHSFFILIIPKNKKLQRMKKVFHFADNNSNLSFD